MRWLPANLAANGREGREKERAGPEAGPWRFGPNGLEHHRNSKAECSGGLEGFRLRSAIISVVQGESSVIHFLDYVEAVEEADPVDTALAGCIETIIGRVEAEVEIKELTNSPQRTGDTLSMEGDNILLVERVDEVELKLKAKGFVVRTELEFVPDVDVVLREPGRAGADFQAVQNDIAGSRIP